MADRLHFGNVFIALLDIGAFNALKWRRNAFEEGKNRSDRRSPSTSRGSLLAGIQKFSHRRYPFPFVQA
jgi:hypothetical protein